MNTEKKRLDYIDTAKGIGMLIVIMLHTSINYPNNPYTNSLVCNFLSRFFMPIFFLLSGLFFSCKKPFREFFKNKLKRLVVPFLVFYTLTYLLNILIIKIFGIETKNTFSYLDIFQVFYKDVFSNNVIWFLLAIFWCQIILYCIEKYLHNAVVKPILIVLLFIIGYLCHEYRINIPLYIDTALSALPYLYVGYLFKKINILNIIDTTNPTIKRNALLLLVSIISGLICYYCGTKVSLVNNSYGDPIRFLVQGVAGSIMVIAFCRIIHWIPIINYVGKVSLIVLCIHMYMINLFSLFIKKIDASFYIKWGLTIFLVCISFYIIAPLFKKYLPWAVGEIKSSK